MAPAGRFNRSAARRKRSRLLHQENRKQAEKDARDQSALLQLIDRMAFETHDFMSDYGSPWVTNKSLRTP